MHLLHLPTMLERLLVLKQWSDDNLMEWVQKTFINSLDLTFEFKGASARERLKPKEEEKGQAGRPTACRPPLLRIFLLRTLWFFPSLCFTEFCSWFHYFAIEANIYSIYRLWSRGCFTKRCFWLGVDIQWGLRCSRYRNSQCMDRMASKREVRKNTEWSAS